MNLSWLTMMVNFYIASYSCCHAFSLNVWNDDCMIAVAIHIMAFHAGYDSNNMILDNSIRSVYSKINCGRNTVHLAPCVCIMRMFQL